MLQPPKELKRWLGAVTAVTLAAIAREALHPFLGNSIPFGLFFLSITITAQRTGFLPAAFATFLSGLTCSYFFIEPRFQFAVAASQDLFAVLLFILVGLAIARLGGRLHSERNSLQAIIDSANNAHFAYLDRNFNFVMVNKAYASTCGYKPEEMVGKNHFVLYPHAENEKIFRRVRDSGERAEFRDKPFEFPDQPKRGLTYWDWTLAPVKNASGFVEALILALSETTNRKRLELELRESQARLSLTYDKLGVGIVEVEGDDRFVAANERALEILGYSRDELFKLSVKDLTYRDDLLLSDRMNAAIHAGGQDRIAYEKRYLTKSGSAIWVHVTVSAVRDDSGKWIRSITSIEDISERKRTEDALRESETQMRLATESAHLGTWEAALSNSNPCPPFRYSKHIGPMFGEAEGFVHESAEAWAEQIHFEDRENVVAKFKAAVQGEEEFHTDFRVVWKDGTTRWLAMYATILKLDGKPLRAIGVAQDITERKRTEELARIREERFRRLVEVSSEIVWVTNAQGQPEEDSPSWRAFTGRAIDQWLGENWLETVHADDRARVWAQWQEAVQTKGAYTAEFRMLHHSGEYRHVQCRAVPILNSDGTIGEWIGMNTDVTAEKKAENDLRESQSFLKEVFETVYDSIIIHAPDGRLVDVNSRYLEMYGVSYEEALSYRIPELSAPSAQIETLPDRWAQVLNGRPQLFEWKARRPRSNSEFDVEVYLKKVTLGGNELIMANVRDITERKQSEKAIQAAMKELREQDRRKDEFLAMLAHELRNPMSTISAAAELLSRTSPASQLPLLEPLKRQTKHLAKLVDDLLDVSRIIRGKVALDKETVELTEVIRQAIEASKTEIEQGQHSLSVELPNEPLPTYGDPLRLQQVIANILSNAARYSEQRGQIRLEAWRTGKTAVIEVRDAGVGIPRESLERIFEPFTQLAVGLHRSKGGLGIGLTLVKQLTEMHGGSVQAASEGPGKGSTFTVRLPLSEALQAPTDHEPVVLNNGLEILVVDDNRDSAVMVAALLAQAGHITKAAFDGESALECALAEHYDVILLDIGLPGLDGFEVARRVRASGRQAPLLVAVTGYGQEHDRRASEEAGFDAHLLKPLQFEALSAIMAQWQASPRANLVQLARAEQRANQPYRGA